MLLDTHEKYSKCSPRQTSLSIWQKIHVVFASFKVLLLLYIAALLRSGAQYQYCLYPMFVTWHLVCFFPPYIYISQLFIFSFNYKQLHFAGMAIY